MTDPEAALALLVSSRRHRELFLWLHHVSHVQPVLLRRHHRAFAHPIELVVTGNLPTGLSKTDLVHFLAFQAGAVIEDRS